MKNCSQGNLSGLSVLKRVGLCFALCVLVGTTAFAQTERYVPGTSGGTPNYGDIASAIAASSAGDTIWLDSGASYVESPTVDKDITIRKHGSVVTATISGTVTVASTAVGLIDLTINSSTNSAIVFGADGTLTATNCVISSSESLGNGIFSDGTYVSNAVLTGCDISNSTKHAIRVNAKTGSWTVTNSTLNNNGANAVKFVGDSAASAQLVFDGCDFDGNAVHVFALSGVNGMTVDVSDCTFANTVYRTVSFSNSGQSTVTLKNIAIVAQANAGHPHVLMEGGPCALILDNATLQDSLNAGVEFRSTATDSVLEMRNGAAITGSDSYGVLVSSTNSFTLEMVDSAVSSNDNTGIYNSGGAVAYVTLTNSNLQNNVGRGLDLRNPTAVVNIDGGTFSGNGSDSQFVVQSTVNNATINIANATFTGKSGNAAPFLFVAPAQDITMSNVTVTGGGASRGIQFNNSAGVSTLTLSNGTSFSNISGDALYVRGDLDLTMDNASISGVNQSGGTAAIYMDGANAGVLALTILNGSVISNSANGIYGYTTPLHVSMDNSSITGHAGVAIDDTSAGGSSDFQLNMANGSDISGNTVAGVQTACATPVLTGTGTPSSIEGGTSASLVLNGTAGQNVTLDGIVLTGAGSGLASESADATLVASNCEFSTNTGLGIWVDSDYGLSATLNSCSVAGNSDRGIRSNGTITPLVMDGCVVRGNGSNAIQLSTFSGSSPINATIDRTLITENASIAFTFRGDGDGILSMTGSTITNNPYRALNLSNTGVSTVTLSDSTLSANTLGHPLVMVDNCDGVITLDNSTIEDSFAECVYVRDDATLNLKLNNGSVISNADSGNQGILAEAGAAFLNVTLDGGSSMESMPVHGIQSDAAELNVSILGGSSLSGIQGRGINSASPTTNITMDDGSITGCGGITDSAVNFGSAVISGSLNMANNSSISNNPTRGVLSGTDLVVTMDNSAINSNSNNAIQANVLGKSLDLTMTNNSTIDSNAGAAVYYKGDLTLVMTDSSMDGNTSGAPTVWQTGGAGTTDVTMARSSISNNMLSAFQSVDDFSLSTDWTMTDSSIENNGQKGLLIRSGTQNLNFSGSTMSGNADIALESSCSGDIALTAVIEGCTFANNAGRGILFSAGGGTADTGSITISDSDFVSNGTANIESSRNGGTFAFNDSRTSGSQIGIWLSTGAMVSSFSTSTLLNNNYGAIIRAGEATFTACDFENNWYRAIESRNNVTAVDCTFFGNTPKTGTNPFGGAIGDRMIGWELRSGWTGPALVTLTNCSIESPLRVIATDNLSGSPQSMQVDVDGCTFNNAEGTLFYPAQTDQTTLTLNIANSDALSSSSGSFFIARDDNTRSNTIVNVDNSTFANFTSAFTMSTTRTMTLDVDQCTFVAAQANVNHILINDQATELTNVTVRDSAFQATPASNALHNRSSVATLWEDYNAFTPDCNPGSSITSEGNSIEVLASTFRFASTSWGNGAYLVPEYNSTLAGLNSGVGGSETYAGAKEPAPRPTQASPEWTLY